VSENLAYTPGTYLILSCWSIHQLLYVTDVGIDQRRRPAAVIKFGTDATVLHVLFVEFLRYGTRVLWHLRRKRKNKISKTRWRGCSQTYVCICRILSMRRNVRNNNRIILWLNLTIVCYHRRHNSFSVGCAVINTPHISIDVIRICRDDNLLAFSFGVVAVAATVAKFPDEFNWATGDVSLADCLLGVLLTRMGLLLGVDVVLLQL
jgi:hypothetical protein